MDETGTHPPTAEAGTVLASPPLSRRERLRGPFVTAGIVGGLSLALHVRDPHTSGSWGGCPWLALTGQYCPGCGALRAVNDLTNGDLVAAASSNLVFVLLIPVLVLGWVRWTQRAWSGAETPRTRHRAGPWIAAAAVVMVVFTVARNVPAGSWLAP